MTQAKERVQLKMQQNFNLNEGLSHPLQGNAPNDLGLLSGRTISYSHSSPIQQSFPQSWPTTQGWQSSDNQNLGYALPYQRHNSGKSGYSAIQQQDYVPFDEAEDFYANDDGTAIDNVGELHNSSHSMEKSPEKNLRANSQQQSTTRNIKADALKMHEPKAQRSAVSLDAANGELAAKPITDASEQLAQLRAKLIADKQRKSATPTPIKPSKHKSDKLNKGPNEQSMKERAGEETYSGQIRNTTEDQPSHKAPRSKAENESSKMSLSPSSAPSTSQADIESLFSEVKAGMSGNRNRDQALTRERALANLSLTAPKKTLKDSNEELHHTKRDHSLDGKSPSSEVSELGEIREDIAKSCPDRPAPKAGVPPSKRSATAAVDSRMSLNGKSDQPAGETMANTADTHDRKSAASKPPAKSSDTLRLTNANITSSRPPGASQSPQKDRTQPRADRPHASYVTEHGHDIWRRDSQDFSQRQTQGSRGYLNGSERVPFERDRHYGDINTLSLASTDTDNAKRAAKTNESSDAPRNADSESKTRSQQANPSEKRLTISTISQSDKPKTPVNTKVQHTTAIDESHEASANPSQGLINVIEPSMFANQQIYEDVLDWLEMTDWNDVSYRNQSLARHRKLKALDVQRAELEREAQFELEQRSRSVRARSILPIESGALRSVFSPQLLRTPSGPVMAPPPLPPNQSEDLGMKIKDLASIDMQVTAGNTETSRNNKLSTTAQSGSSATTKRERIEDFDAKNSERAEKLPRLDLGDRVQNGKTLASPAIKNESFESRITRDNEPRSMGNRRRSMSPERRKRSPSPVNRRASNAGGYYNCTRGLEFPKGDRYSPRGSRNTSPVGRDIGARGLSSYNEPPPFERDFESRIQYNRDSEYQSFRPRGSGRGRYNNHRGNYRSFGSKGGYQGRTNGSEFLNLKQGGQSRD